MTDHAPPSKSPKEASKKNKAEALRFSKRTGWPSSENPLTEAARKKRSSSARFIDGTESNPTPCTFRYTRPDILKPFSALRNLSYAPDLRGDISAREAVCRYYAEHGAVVHPEQVF